MRLFAFLRREASLEPRLLITRTLIGAGSTVAVLALVSFSAADARNGNPGLRMLALLAIAVGLFAQSQNAMMSAAAREAEEIIRRLRARLFDAVQHASYMAVASTGRATLHAAMAQETQTLSRTVPLLVIAAQQALTLLFVAAFLAMLSLPAFVAAAAFGTAAVLVHIRRSKAMAATAGEAVAAEARLFQDFEHLLGGFRELRVNRARAEELADAIEACSDEVRLARTATKRRWAQDFVIVQALFFGLVALMTFVVPLIDAGFPAVALEVTTVALFVIGPISVVAQAIPAIAETEASLDRILAVEAGLVAATGSASEEEVPLAAPVAEIALDGATYVYRLADGTPGFVLGPIDLKLKAGEVVFVTGGNGAGKTTFLRLLVGLLPPESGVITVNGEALAVGQRQAYRDSVSAILADYHLFRRLYGIGPIDPDRLAGLIDRLEIGSKVTVRDGAFSTVDLSSGQRKRLALLVAELENKPVLVLDEWAADQDPAFRARFYREILPTLRRPGRIVICATHDERYFDCADRILDMRDGRISELTRR